MLNTTTPFKMVPATVSTTKAQWTTTYKTEYIRQLPYHIAPFAIGVALKPHHLRTLAEALCSPEMLELEKHDYHSALVAHMFEKDEMQTFIPLPHPDTHETFYLWVKAIMPSYNGKRPQRDPLPMAVRAAFCKYLRKLGFSNDHINEITMASADWPKHLAYPAWLPARLECAVRQQMEAAKLKMKPKADGAEVEKTIDVASSTTKP